MAKHVIAIISVLKPVDDTRNFEKIARTLSNTNKYEINIIGFSSKKNPAYPNIKFHPVFAFERSSIKRVFASFKIFKILFKVKPEVIIVTCAELLIVTVLNKILFGGKIIYDIQENYFRNAAYSSVYPFIFRYPIAYSIRTIELLASTFIDHFFLAEKVYQRQIGFTALKSAVIENRAVSFPEKHINNAVKDEITLLYSGTIAQHYGIFDAIRFVDRLRQKEISVKLIIAGYAAQKGIHKKLIATVKGKRYIRLIVDNAPLPREEIIKEVLNADFCILPYQQSKSTAGRIPTKLYECLSIEKPVIISPNPAWNDLIKINNAGIIYDFTQNHEFTHKKLREKYYGNNMCNEYKWDRESDKVLRSVSALIADLVEPKN